jgi:tetraacyldisaccharide 4'-kinase
VTASWLERQWWRTPPTLTAHALRPLSALYAALAALDRAAARPRMLPVPVVVVGNLVAGGAGKTPTTISLVLALRERGWTPGVVSRGYGRTLGGIAEVGPASRATEVGDEPLLIARRAACPVFVASCRVDAGQALLSRHPQVDIVVADDGLQHHALARDAQLIVIDERGFGNGLLLPAGPLRERPARQVPARSVVLYNADAATSVWPGWTAQRRLRGAVLLSNWTQGQGPEPHGLNALRKHRIVAAAGIASPQRFFAMLRDLGLEFEARPLPDHHDWRDPPALRDDEQLLVTEKDAVKIDPAAPIAQRTWVAPLDFTLPSSLTDALAALLPPPPQRS